MTATFQRRARFIGDDRDSFVLPANGSNNVTAISIGDFVAWDGTSVISFTDLTDVGAKLDNRLAARAAFAGVAQTALAAATAGSVTIARRGVFTFPCTSGTYKVGDQLAPEGTGSGGNVGVSATTLVAVATANDGTAIAKCFKAGTTVTSVQAYFESTLLLTPGVSGLDSTGSELNRIADVSSRIVNCTASTLTVTEAEHCDKIITLNRAGGIAVTLPAAAAGLRFKFIVGTTFTAASTIKSVTGADIMIGHALMGNDSDNSVVEWPALAASTYDTISMFGTANSTGGIAGEVIEIIGLAANLWWVEKRGDAAGTEDTPFADTVT